MIELVTVALLITETILLVLTVILLFMSHREYVGREKLLESMLFTVRVFHKRVFSYSNRRVQGSPKIN